MKIKILSGLICYLGILSANAQTITAPVGQSLTVTNPIDITVAGGSINVPNDGSYNFGTTKIIQYKNANFSLGDNAGFTSGAGIQNIFIGINSGYNNSSGYDNSFIGSNSGKSNTSGAQNLYFGTNAGLSNTTGSNNAFLGTNSGYSNTTGVQNINIGTYSGYKNISGNNNNFIGYFSGSNNTLGSENMFMGAASGQLNTIGSYNSFVGSSAGYSNTTGSSNTFLGFISGYYNTTGNDNTYIGYLSGGSPSVTNSTAIGARASVTANNSIVLGNNASVGIGNTAPNSKLEITSGVTDKSGLRFTNLTSASTPINSSGTTGKVLSVNGNGDVILVQITGAGVSTQATGPIAENWKESEGYLYNNSTNGVVIKGTGLDGNALIVKGGVLSTEVNVKVEGSEAWPDYVFKPTYKRMSLGEVGKFIAINGHLPNIPSATEMAISGNNLGKTDVKLLEKVEELTLYLLDMKKVNDAQAAELKSLKKQVSKLRKK